MTLAIYFSWGKAVPIFLEIDTLLVNLTTFMGRINLWWIHRRLDFMAGLNILRWPIILEDDTFESVRVQNLGLLNLLPLNHSAVVINSLIKSWFHVETQRQNYGFWRSMEKW